MQIYPVFLLLIEIRVRVCMNGVFHLPETYKIKVKCRNQNGKDIRSKEYATLCSSLISGATRHGY